MEPIHQVLAAHQQAHDLRAERRYQDSTAYDARVNSGTTMQLYENSRKNGGDQLLLEIVAALRTEIAAQPSKSALVGTQDYLVLCEPRVQELVSDELAELANMHRARQTQPGTVQYLSLHDNAKTPAITGCYPRTHEGRSVEPSGCITIRTRGPLTIAVSHSLWTKYVTIAIGLKAAWLWPNRNKTSRKGLRKAIRKILDVLYPTPNLFCLELNACNWPGVLKQLRAEDQLSTTNSCTQ